ncbi:MAG: tetratricopeptide repeat protein [Candidatus Saccharicenans sp.]
MSRFLIYLKFLTFLSLSFNFIFYNSPALLCQENPGQSTEISLREVNLQLIGDEEFAAIPDGRQKVEKALSEVSAEFEELFGLRFNLLGWSSFYSENNLKKVEALADSLGSFQRNKKADILLAVTGQKGIDQEYSGISVFKAAVVIIIYTPEQEKLKRLLAHELGHAFGGVHVPMEDSVMSCHGSGNRFDSDNQAIIRLGRNRRFERYKFPWPVEIQSSIEEYYLKIREKILRLVRPTQFFNEANRPHPSGLDSVDLNPYRCLSDCFLMLSQIELEKKNYQPAVKFCEEALKINPDDFEALNLKAIALRRSGEVDKSVAIYQFILKNDYQPSVVLFNLGIAYSKLNQLQEAEKAYQEALRRSPVMVEAHNNLGEIYLREGRLEEAEREFQKAVELAPEFALSYSNLADLYLRLKQLKKAQYYVERAIKIDPELASAHNILGNLRRQEGRVEEAQQEYQKALDLDPTYEKAWYNLGVAASDLGQWERAKEFFWKSIKLQPNFAEGYAGLGLYYLQVGDWDKAIGYLKQARELGYRNPALNVNLSYAYMNKKDWKEAEEEARRAISEQPDLALAYNNLGIALAQQNRLEESRAVLEKSLKLKAEDRDALMNLATVELSHNNEERALELFLKAVSLNPNDRRNGLLYNNIAVIYFHQKKYNLSWEFCQKAIQAGFKVEESFISELEKKIKKDDKKN